MYIMTGVNGIRSDSFPVAGFGISSVRPLVAAAVNKGYPSFSLFEDDFLPGCAV
jgi:hypothetical protein